MTGGDRARTRQPRLGIVDVYDLDRQRQLILLRRDNVEHLLLIGGPNDLMVETNIVRVAGARLPGGSTEVSVERQRRGRGTTAGAAASASCPSRSGLARSRRACRRHRPRPVSALPRRHGRRTGPRRTRSSRPSARSRPQPAAARTGPALKPDAVQPAPSAAGRRAIGPSPPAARGEGPPRAPGGGRLRPRRLPSVRLRPHARRFPRRPQTGRGRNGGRASGRRSQPARAGHRPLPGPATRAARPRRPRRAGGRRRGAPVGYGSPA